MRTVFLGYDPNGVRRVYATYRDDVESEARDYVRRRPDTGPLNRWRFEEVQDIGES